MRVGYAQNEAPRAGAAGVSSQRPVLVAPVQILERRVELLASIIDQPHVLVAQDDVLSLCPVQKQVESRIGIGLLRTGVVDVEELARRGIEATLPERGQHCVILGMVVDECGNRVGDAVGARFAHAHEKPSRSRAARRSNGAARHSLVSALANSRPFYSPSGRPFRSMCALWLRQRSECSRGTTAAFVMSLATPRT